MAWIDELERDLGQAARLRLIQAAGGQRRDVPSPGWARRSHLAEEAGAEVALWLARRFGGTAVDIPSARGREAEDRAGRLRAAVLEAGLDTPRRSANDLAAEHGVTATHVRRVRAELRADRQGGPREPSPQLTLFGD